MARITVEDCLEKVPNRFKLVHMAAARVRQIREGSEYLVSSPKNEDIVVAPAGDCRRKGDRKDRQRTIAGCFKSERFPCPGTVIPIRR